MSFFKPAALFTAAYLLFSGCSEKPKEQSSLETKVDEHTEQPKQELIIGQPKGSQDDSLLNAYRMVVNELLNGKQLEPFKNKAKDTSIFSSPIYTINIPVKKIQPDLPRITANPNTFDQLFDEVKANKQPIDYTKIWTKDASVFVIQRSLSKGLLNHLKSHFEEFKKVGVSHILHWTPHTQNDVFEKYKKGKITRNELYEKFLYRFNPISEDVKKEVALLDSLKKRKIYINPEDFNRLNTNRDTLVLNYISGEISKKDLYDTLINNPYEFPELLKEYPEAKYNKDHPFIGNPKKYRSICKKFIKILDISKKIGFTNSYYEIYLQSLFGMNWDEETKKATKNYFNNKISRKEMYYRKSSGRRSPDEAKVCLELVDLANKHNIKNIGVPMSFIPQDWANYIKHLGKIDEDAKMIFIGGPFSGGTGRPLVDTLYRKKKFKHKDVDGNLRYADNVLKVFQEYGINLNIASYQGIQVPTEFSKKGKGFLDYNLIDNILQIDYPVEGLYYNLGELVERAGYIQGKHEQFFVRVDRSKNTKAWPIDCVIHLGEYTQKGSTGVTWYQLIDRNIKYHMQKEENKTKK